MSFQRLATCLVAVAMTAVSLQAAEVGYWRMETDLNAGGGFEIPNEFGSGTNLIGAAGSVDPTSVPVNPIPQTGAINGFSLNGSPNINGSIAEYPELNFTSGTIEFYFRSNEGDARYLLRESGSEGLRVDQPNDVRVQYSVDDGGGGSTRVTLDTNIDSDANWDHFAFTYDELSGVGRAYLNGVEVATDDGPDNRGLVWPSTALLVGDGLDGGGGFSGNSEGLMDELRISDTVLLPAQFLNAEPIPEPASVALLGLGLLGGGALLWLRRRNS